MTIIIISCKSTPLDRKNPASAFGRLSVCVDKASVDCLFKELDRGSRWSVHSIYRTLAQTRGLISNSYPTDNTLRDQALGTWKKEAASKNAAEMFRVFCQKRSCLRTLAQGFGAVVKVKKTNENTAIVETTRGKTFQMSAAEGEWGLATYKDELYKTKIRLMDNLKQVRRNAAAYDEQRRAVGTDKEK